MKSLKKTLSKNTWAITILVALSFLIGCREEEDRTERELQKNLKFSGEAYGIDEDVTIECQCDLLIELPKFKTKANGMQQYTGSMGGIIARTITDDEGAGFSFQPDLYGLIEVTLKPNDSIYLSWPANLGTGVSFYDDIALFKGILNRDNGSITGKWRCSPFEIDEGGWVDLVGSVEGEWEVTPLE